MKFLWRIWRNAERKKRKKADERGSVTSIKECSAVMPPDPHNSQWGKSRHNNQRTPE